MAKGSDHIWERGDQYYLKLAITAPDAASVPV